MEQESLPTKNHQRRRQILAATLRLLRKHGTDISTAQIAAEAHCSKETLYNWFGDREGIMMALVLEQARGMGAALQSGFGKQQGGLEEQMISASILLLDILTGEAALAVNRLAMAQACTEGASLGLAALAEWDEQIAAPFLSLFDEGNQSGELAVQNPQEAFHDLIGLLLGDRQRQLLLGAQSRPMASIMQQIAEGAVKRWLILYRA